MSQKKNKIKECKLFRQMDTVEYVPDNGFLFQWCCDCHLRHIWHFEILPPNEKWEDGRRVIKISGIDDRIATSMRRRIIKK